MRCIAHRGFAGLYPENTLTAIEQAAQVADVIEVDIRRCGSGELVVIHDETVDRVTDGEGRVADLSLERLQSLDVLGTGEGVPTLGAVLEALPADVGLDVELKATGIAADVVEAVAGHETVWLSSFDTDALAAASEGSDRPLILLVDSSAEAAIERAGSIEYDAIGPHWRLVDFALIERAHRSDLDVYPWTIQNAAKATELQRMGVDGVIADEPAACPGPE